MISIVLLHDGPFRGTVRSFPSLWKEAVYLRNKALRWGYGRPRSPARAAAFAERLAPILRSIRCPSAIAWPEFWSVYWEFQGDLRLAIRYRRREIALWKRLMGLPNVEALDPTWMGGWGDLVARLLLLASLQERNGDHLQAKGSWTEAREVAKQHRIKFAMSPRSRDLRMGGFIAELKAKLW